jgi:hypothetical protein
MSDDDLLLKTLNSYQFQEGDLGDDRFTPSIYIESELGEMDLSRTDNDLVPFSYPSDNKTADANVVTVTKSLINTYSYYYMDIDLFTTEEKYPVISATLHIDTQLAGIDNGHIKLTAQNTGRDDIKGSTIFSYGPRNLKLDIDTTQLTIANSTFITLSNDDISLKLVATCATDKNDEGTHDADGIMACADELNFSGDIFVNGATDKVAIIEDRDGLPVIKFVGGDSYGVVMTPNFDFVKQ